MSENSKRGTGARTLWLGVFASVFVHAAILATGLALGAGWQPEALDHHGDVIQVSSVDIHPETAPKPITPESRDAPAPAGAPTTPTAPKKVHVKRAHLPIQPKAKDANAIEVAIGPDAGVAEGPDAGALALAGDAGPAADPDAPPPAASADLGPYAPGDARIIAIVRSDRVRGSGMRGGAEALLAALPDTKMILSGTGLSPFDDFDTVLVATSDPADVSQTFLAGHGRTTSAALMKALAGPTGTRVAWTQMKGRAVGQRSQAPGWDPRLYVVAGPHWMVFGRPEQLGALGDRKPEPVSDADGGAGDGGAAAPVPVPPAWSKRLGEIATVAGDDDDSPALVMSVADLRGALRLPPSFAPRLPKHATFAVRLETEAATVWGTVVFADPAGAKRFAVDWKGWRADAAADTFMAFLGVPALMDKVALDLDGPRVLLRTHMMSSQVDALLRFMAKQVLERAEERLDHARRIIKGP